MDMYKNEDVLCGASKYEKKFYLDERFEQLPDVVKDELKIMCVLYTEEVGGILTLEFDEDGNLEFVTRCKEGDLLYDEIGAGLKIKQLRKEKQQLLEEIELYNRVVVRKENINLDEEI